MTFASGADKVLADFSAPFAGEKILGDYQYLTALGNAVYGTFAGRGLAAAQNPNGFDRSSNIDPFYFNVLPELLSRPQLKLTRSGPYMILSWPTNFNEFTLQSTPNFGPSIVWSTNFAAPVVVNGQNAVTNPISGTQQFFRLSK
jgi:hypothetical protein